MVNRVQAFQNIAIVSSIPEGLLDPEEMGSLGLSQEYWSYLQRVIERLSVLAADYEKKLGTWPEGQNQSAMYRSFFAKATGARTVIDELKELQFAMRTQADEKERGGRL
jgi:hypothetical protein